MSFAWPWMLLLLPLPWLAWQLLPPARRDAPLQVPSLVPFDALAASSARPGRIGPVLWLAACAWLLLVLAATRPQALAELDAFPVSGRDLMLAIDVSGSMATPDLRIGGRPVDRLEAARLLAADFLDGRDGDRVGLIVFGSQAYLHTPLTFDLDAVRAALADTGIGLAGRETAIGDAIALAARRLREFGDSARVLVLLTDGANTAGELTPQQALWIAQREGLRIHTVGIGAEHMRVVTPEGVREINPSFDLDEETLREIAAQTGGAYVRATDGDALAAFYRLVDELEPTAAASAELRPVRELYRWPLGLALALALWPLWRAVRRLAHGPGGPWRDLVDARLRPFVLASDEGRGRLGALALLALGGGLALAALAGIARPTVSEIAWRADAARVLVVDLSPAMEPDGVAPSPMERTRLKLLDLLAALPSGQTALIAYAEEPYLVAPLTTDAATIALLVPELGPDAVPVAGNEPERALRMAADVLERSGASARDLVWITSAIPDAEMLEALGERFGTGLRASILHVGEDGGGVLTRFTESTGGRYLAMTADAVDVEALTALLAETGPLVAEGRRAGLGVRELGPWLVLLLLPLAALAFRRGVLLAALALPLLLLPAAVEADSGLAGLWTRADRYALRLLEAGDAEAAARAFTDPRWRAVALHRAGRHAEAAAVLAPLDDWLAHYNRGNALAHLGRLDEALAAYDRALALRPGDPDIAHNRELVQVLLQRPPPPPEGGPEGDADDDSVESSGGADPQPNGTDDAEAGEGGEIPADSSGAVGGEHDAPEGQVGERDTAPTSLTQDTEHAASELSGSAPFDRSEDEGSRPEPDRSPDSTPGADGPSGEATRRDTAAAQPADLPRGQADPAREADLLAEQWLRRVPDEPATLLRRKLQFEHERRQRGEGEQSWR